MDRCLQDWRHHGISGHPLRTFWLYHPKRHPSGVAFLVSSLKTITAKNYIWGKEKCWKTIRYLSLLAACVVRRRAPLATPSTADREHLPPCCEQPTQQFVGAPCRAVKTLQWETRADGCLRHRIELLIVFYQNSSWFWLSWLELRLEWSELWGAGASAQDRHALQSNSRRRQLRACRPPTSRRNPEILKKKSRDTR